MFLKKISQLLLCILFTTALLSTANAATADYSFSFVLSTFGDNPYGLNTGDVISVSGEYNAENVNDPYGDGVYSMHSADSDGDFTFSLELNDQVSYTDDSRSESWPTVTFLISDWSIDNIDFETTDDTLNAFIKIMVAELDDPIDLTAVSSLYDVGQDGYWSITGSPVPVPGTLTLISLGLLGLSGINRRRSLK